MSFVNINNLKEKEIWPGIMGKFVHSDKMTIAFVTIEKGIDLPEHAHEHEQVLNLIEGEFEVVVAGEKTILKPGNSFVLPSNIPHAGRTLSKCRIIDVFHPVREDFKKL